MSDIEIRKRSMWQLRNTQREFKVQVLDVDDGRVLLFFADGSREWMNLPQFLVTFEPYAWVHPVKRHS